MTYPLRYPSLAVLAACLSAAVLSGCNQNGQPTQNAAAAPPPALPLTTGAETAPVAAPLASALPRAPRPKIVRVASQADEYAYADQASEMNRAFSSAPPDYGFDYNGVRPWVWRTHDNAVRLVEPTEGGYRYYYYQPGAADPYLVRDPQYSYGYNNGELVVVYDSRGNVIPPDELGPRADYAGRYLARAQALYAASLQSERRSVIAANWAARSAAIMQEQDDWRRQQDQVAAWRAYHDQHDAQQQSYWQDERERRQLSAARFDQWRQAGYQGAPPPPAPFTRPQGGPAPEDRAVQAPPPGPNPGTAFPPSAGPPYVDHGPGFNGEGGRYDAGRPGGPVGFQPPQGGAPTGVPSSAAQAQLRAQNLAQQQNQARAESQLQAQARSQAQAQSRNQAAALAEVQARAQGQAQAEVQARAAAQAQSRAQAQLQSEAQSQARAQAQAHAVQARQQQNAQVAADRAAAQNKALEAARVEATAAAQVRQQQGLQVQAARQAEAASKAAAQSQAQAARQSDVAARAQQMVAAHQQAIAKAAAAQAAAAQAAAAQAAAHAPAPAAAAASAAQPGSHPSKDHEHDHDHDPGH